MVSGEGGPPRPETHPETPPGGGTPRGDPWTPPRRPPGTPQTPLRTSILTPNPEKKCPKTPEVLTFGKMTPRGPPQGGLGPPPTRGIRISGGLGPHFHENGVQNPFWEQKNPPHGPENTKIGGPATHFVGLVDEITLRTARESELKGGPKTASESPDRRGGLPYTIGVSCQRSPIYFFLIMILMLFYYIVLVY